MTPDAGLAPKASGAGPAAASEASVPPVMPVVLYDAEPPERAWTELAALMFVAVTAIMALYLFVGVLPRGLEATLWAGGGLLLMVGPMVLAALAMSRALIAVRLEGDRLVVRERLLGVWTREVALALDRVKTVSLQDEILRHFRRRAVLRINRRGWKIFQAEAAQCGNLDGRLIAAVEAARGFPLETPWYERLHPITRLALLTGLGLLGVAVAIAALVLTLMLLSPRPG